MPFPLESAVLATSPDSYLMLDETTGPAASDDTGHGRTGVYIGMRLASITGVPGGAPLAPSCFPQVSAPPFNGVALATGFADFARCSAMCWFRWHVASFAMSEVLASATRQATEGWFFQFNSSTQQLGWGVGTSAGYVIIDDPRGVAGYNDGLWHMALGTKDGFSQTSQLYVDGALVAQATGLSPLSIDTGHGAVGYLDLPSASQPFTAEPSNFALWQRVLSTTEVLGIWTAAGASAATPGDISTAVRTGAFPTSYVLGTAVTGLSGSGTIAVPHLYGAWVQFTTIPSTWGFTSDVPRRYVPKLGELHFSDLNGDSEGYQLHYPTELIFSPNLTNLFLRYSLRTGVTATITPILLS